MVGHMLQYIKTVWQGR